MGIRLSPRMNMIPVRLDDGVIKCQIGRTELAMGIPYLKGRSADLQNNFVINPYVVAYMHDYEKGETILLRSNGFGTIFRTDDKVLYSNFKYDIPKELSTIHPERELFGGLLTSINDRAVDKVLCPIEQVNAQTYVLSFPGIAASLSFDIQDEREYIAVLNSGIYTHPELRIKGDTVYAKVMGAQNTLIALNTKVSRGKGVCII